MSMLIVQRLVLSVITVSGLVLYVHAHTHTLTHLHSTRTH